MKIKSIYEAGCNNTLKWAISKGISLETNSAILNLIEDETYYIVRLSDVNMLEVFRLVQTFREKLRIIAENMAEIPSDEDLSSEFPGTLENTDNSTTTLKVSEYVKMTMEQFINIAQQMQSDDDIIDSSMIRLFLPMLTRKYEVQFPISFMQLFSSLKHDEIVELFTPQYPENLESFIFDSGHNGITYFIQLMFAKLTSIVKCDNKYTSMLKNIKYASLNKVQTDKLYRYKLSGFWKYDNVNRSQVKYSMFNVNKNELSNKMKTLSRIQTSNSVYVNTIKFLF